MNISTVYRTLELLEQLSLVTHSHLGHGAPSYHLAAEAEHVHLVCRECGRIEEVGPDAVAPLVTALEAGQDFETDVRHLTVFGRCGACRQARPRPPAGTARSVPPPEDSLATMESPLLRLPGAVPADGPDAGVAAHYGDPFGEQRALARAAGLVDRSHRGVVRITGPDRLSWLNSLTTQRLEPLPAGHRRPDADPEPERARRTPSDADRRRQRGVGARRAGHRG